MVAVGNASATSVALALTSQPTADVSIRCGERLAAGSGWGRAGQPPQHPCNLHFRCIALSNHDGVVIVPPRSLSTCSISVPTAGWANASLATVSPASLTIPAAAWNSSQTIQLQPAEAFTDGSYFVSLQFQ